MKLGDEMDNRVIKFQNKDNVQINNTGGGYSI